MFKNLLGLSSKHVEGGSDCASLAKARLAVKGELDAGDVPILVAEDCVLDNVKGRLVLSTQALLFGSEKWKREQLTLIAGDEQQPQLSLKCGDRKLHVVLPSLALARLFREQLSAREKESKYEPSPRQMDLQNSNAFGSFVLTVIKADNLLAMDSTGKSDPFVRATLQYKVPGKDKEKEHPESTLQTRYVVQSLKPSWNEPLAWDITSAPPSSVRLRVLDFDEVGGDDLIGQCVVPVVLSKQAKEEWIPLTTESGFNIVNKLKTSMATHRKEREKAGKKGLFNRKASPDGPAVDMTSMASMVDVEQMTSPSSEPGVVPVAVAEAADSEEQRIQVSSLFKKALALPCSLVLSDAMVPGALLAMERSLAFLNEVQAVVFEVQYTNVVQLLRARRLAVLETTEGVYLLSGFSSSMLYAMINAVSSRFSKPSPFAPKGAAVRMPSVRDLKGMMAFPTGLMCVTVVEGNNLIAKDKVKGEYTSSDPYVTVQLLDASGFAVTSGVAETRVVQHSLMPVWDQMFELNVPQGVVAVLFTVFDKDPGHKKNDDFMGQAVLTADDFKRLVGDQGSWEGWRKLEQRPGRVERVSGSIRVALQVDPKALLEVEDEAAIGIDVYNPKKRKNSTTTLDFDVTNKFATFNGKFKGEVCRIWLSDEAVCAVGENVNVRMLWREVANVQTLERVDSQKNLVRGLTLKGPSRELYIHQPDVNGMDRLRKTYARFREADSASSARPLGDAPATMSFFRMHPFLTLFLHGALVGNHTKTLAGLFVLTSLLLWWLVQMTVPVAIRLCVIIWILSFLSWVAEHVEIDLDWDALIREQDYPLVELDFYNMMTGQALNGYAQSGLVLFGALFMVIGSLPSLSLPILSFSFMFAVLLLIRTMLTKK